MKTKTEKFDLVKEQIKHTPAGKISMDSMNFLLLEKIDQKLSKIIDLLEQDPKAVSASVPEQKRSLWQKIFS